MKNLLLATALLALVTTTVVEAYVQTGHLQQPSQAASTVQQATASTSSGITTTHNGIDPQRAEASRARDGGAAAEASLPEPSTLTVASMGLLALGVAWRSRRHS